jgi:hypothetical protein
MNMEVRQPIFITGIGRSGTTIIHRMLCEHPDVTWLSGLCGRYPKKTQWNRWLMQAVDYPFIGRCIKHVPLTRIFQPWENYDFWDYYSKGFSASCRDLVAADVTGKAKRILRRALGDVLTAKRSRLLVKTTGWPRVGFLHEVFEDGKFIHIVRDGRAVAHSRISMPWWDGWQGPWTWKRGPLSAAYLQEWERHGRSFVALAGIEWKICLDAIRDARRLLNEQNFLEIRYEDFCDNPLRVMQAIAEFCDLPWTNAFEVKLKTYTVRSENHKWQEDLTGEQQRVLLGVTRSHLETYGYLSEERSASPTKPRRAAASVGNV